MFPSSFPENDDFQKLLNDYISFFDDPRITINTAIDYLDSFEDGEPSYDTEYWLDDFFKNNLMASDVSNIRYPIKSIEDLESRCLEIYHLFCFNKLDFTSPYLILALLKMSFNVDRVSYSFFSYDVNPERNFAASFISKIGHSSSSFLRDSALLTIADFDYENGFNMARIKLSIYTNGLLWTKTNVGNAIYNEVSVNDRILYEKRSLENLNKIKIKK